MTVVDDYLDTIRHRRRLPFLRVGSYAALWIAFLVTAPPILGGLSVGVGIFWSVTMLAAVDVAFPLAVFVARNFALLGLRRHVRDGLSRNPNRNAMLMRLVSVRRQQDRFLQALRRGTAGELLEDELRRLREAFALLREEETAEQTGEINEVQRVESAFDVAQASERLALLDDVSLAVEDGDLDAALDVLRAFEE